MTPVIMNPLAMDRRQFDKEGFLHVDKANISKANVCPYLGKEIPDFERLGLDPDKTYRLYRHPQELARAADSFNGKPILCDHVPVSAASIDPEMIVGTTGHQAKFDGQYLTNSLDFWPKSAIDGIESASKRELSCGYAYEPDMTPGTTPSGERYDGVMRNIVGNHVALVREGRAGPDVVVGDSKLRSLKHIMATDYRARRRAMDDAENETGEWLSQLSDDEFERLAGLVDGEDQRRGLDARRKARDTRRARDMETDPNDWSADYRARRRKVSDSEENPNIERNEEMMEPEQPGEDKRAYDGRYSTDAHANMRAHREVDALKADIAIRQRAPGIATDEVGGLLKRFPGAARILAPRKRRDLWEVKQPDGAA